MRISCTDREISLILLVPGDGKTQLREKILKSRREVKRVKQERKYIWFIIGNNDCKTYLNWKMKLIWQIVLSVTGVH